MSDIEQRKRTPSRISYGNECQCFKSINEVEMFAAVGYEVYATINVSHQAMMPVKWFVETGPDAKQ